MALLLLFLGLVFDMARISTATVDEFADIPAGLACYCGPGDF